MFRGQNLKSFINTMSKNSSYFSLKPGSGYPYNEVSLYPIEENFLFSTLIDYYIPKNLQKGINYQKVESKEDIVWSLYSNEGTVNINKNLDIFNVTSRNLTYSHKLLDDKVDLTKQIKIILPQGMESVLSIKGGDTIKLHTLAYPGYLKFFDFRWLIRGKITLNSTFI